MKKSTEIIAVILVILSILGTLGAIFWYESVKEKARHAITLEAHAVSSWSIKEIRVKKGENVRIRIVNRDTVTHGFAIPELDVEEQIINAGQEVMVEFTPQWEGEYVYKCIVQCSRDQHDFMTGTLIVEK